MVDKEQLVEQRWNARNKKYYVSLGYTYTKMGDPFMVKYTDLTPSSTALIKMVCDHCGKEMYIPRLRYERYLSKELGDYCGDCKHIKANFGKQANLMIIGIIAGIAILLLILLLFLMRRRRDER